MSNTIIISSPAPAVPFDFSVDAVEAFTMGDCGYLALAIHLQTGWSLAALHQEDDPLAWGHVGVQLPNGDYLDIEGIWTDTRVERREMEIHSKQAVEPAVSGLTSADPV